MRGKPEAIGGVLDEKGIGGHLGEACCSSVHSSVHGKIGKTITKIKLLSMGSEFLDIVSTGGCEGRKDHQAQKELGKFTDSRSSHGC